VQVLSFWHKGHDNEVRVTGKVSTVELQNIGNCMHEGRQLLRTLVGFYQDDVVGKYLLMSFRFLLATPEY
jgi:hypothetical protein